MTNYSIRIDVSFPNGEHGTPVITTSTTEVDSISDAYSGVEWSLATDRSPDDNVRITGVTFFSDVAKTRAVTPSYMTLPGANNGRMNFIVNFNGTAVDAEQTLYYDIAWADDDFPALEFDPTLKILPRGSGQPGEMQAGAGG